MRFVSVFSYKSSNRLPTEAEMNAMGQLIANGMKEGWLIECEGVHFGTIGVRVQKNTDGKIVVTDGPFAETNEVLGGYAILKADSIHDVVRHTSQFLQHVDQGTWESYQLVEMPAENN